MAVLAAVMAALSAVARPEPAVLDVGSIAETTAVAMYYTELRAVVNMSLATMRATDLENHLAEQLDGCTGVFLDAGANIGMHARFLFEPSSYPDSAYLSIFRSRFGEQGKASREGVCAVEFEPNPLQLPRLHKLATAYATRGWRVIVAPYGVSNARGNLTFYHNDDEEFEEWGFSAFDTGKEASAESEVVVPTLDFSRLVRLIAARDAAAQVTRPVVIKMDIEGSEFVTLSHMHNEGALCAGVDSLTCEFHARDAPFDELGLATEEAAHHYEVGLKRDIAIAGSAADCRLGTVEPLDDESYLDDRSPEQLKDPQPV